MPNLRPLTPDEIADAKSQGLDPSKLMAEDPQPQNAPSKQPMSNLQAVLAREKANIGSQLGGGAAALGTMAALAPFTEGMSLLPMLLTTGLGVGLTGAGGSYLVGKAQQALQGDQTTRNLQQESEEAAKEHPITSAATDIAGSAILSGGKPSLANISKALAGDSEALGKIGVNAILNPAINTGIDLATGQTPTASGLLSQVAGGALFSEANPLGRLAGGVHKAPDGETAPEVTAKDVNLEPTQESSPFTATDAATGQPTYNDSTLQQLYKLKLGKKPQPSDLAKLPDDDARLQAIQKWQQGQATLNDPVALRQQMHEDYLNGQKQAALQADLNKPTQPPSNEPNVTDANKPGSDTGVSDAYINARVAQTDRLKAATLEPQEIAQRESLLAKSEGPTLPTEAQTSDLKSQAPNSTDQQQVPTLAQDDKVKSQALRQTFHDATQEYFRSQDPTRSDPAYHQVLEQKRNAMQQAAEAVQRQEDFQKARLEQAAQNEQSSQGQGQSFSENPNTKRIPNPEAIKQQMQSGIEETPGLDAALKASQIEQSTQPQEDEQRVPFVPKENTGGMSIDEWLSGKKFGPDDKVYGGLGAFEGAGKAIWNTSIDVIRAAVKAGKALHEAVKDGVNWIKQNHPNFEFDEDAYTKEVTKQETPTKAQPKVEIPQETKRVKGTGFLASVIDKVRQSAHPDANYAADQLKLTANKQEQLNGQWNNRRVALQNKLGWNKALDDKMLAIRDWHNDNPKQTLPSNSPLLSDPKIRQMYTLDRQIHDEQGKHRIAIKEPVMDNGVPRLLRQNPTQFSTSISPKVIEVKKLGADRVAINKLDSDFINNALDHGFTQKQAEQLLDRANTSIQGQLRDPHSDLSRFNAARLPEGTPIPKSWQLRDYAKSMESYDRRMAADNAFYEHIESNRRMLSILGEKKDPWGNDVPRDPHSGMANNPAMRSALSFFHGENTDAPTRTGEATAGLAATALVSSPAIQSHIVLSNQVGVFGLMDNPIQYGMAMFHALANINEGVAHAEANGAISLRASKLSDVLDTTLTAAQRLQALASGIRKLSSFGLDLPKWQTGFMQGELEYVMPSKIARAANGDKTQQAYLKNLDPSYDPSKTYSPKEMSKLASRAIAYIAGTHDIRTMPSFMLHDTETSGFFQLAHWSISQTNRFMSDIYTPATRGDFKPLLMAVVGSSIGGFIIKNLREELQGKKSPIPSLHEIASSEGGLQGNKGLVAYNLIAALQYAGFAGLLSQGVRYGFDAAYKNQPQGAIFPLDEIASDVISSGHEFLTAKANDPNFDMGDATIELVNHLLTTNIQMARMGYNQAINDGIVTGSAADKKLLSDKLGQLRRFDMTSGLPYDEADNPNANPYMNIEQKKFKRTQDIGEAMQQLPGLINNIVTNYAKTPDVMLQKLKALKQNVYETMPSLESMPIEFMKYIAYLQREEGPEQAQATMQDYFRHKFTNAAKASVVP